MDRGSRWRYVDNFKRKFFLKSEIKKKMLKSITKNSLLPITYRYYALFNKSKQPRWGSIIQQKNKCVKTGKVWSTVKSTRYSRFVFRTESYNGNIPGFQRASW